MHTSGEVTRIIFQGYPDLQGTLLEQRTEALLKHDHIRKTLILEPRGHSEMYGAILRTETESTMSGEAHMGVLFMTNEGYSTMCGHACIALGRFLVDCHDSRVFPKRNQLLYNSSDQTVTVRLHAPCGLIVLTVPTVESGTKSDASGSVAFVNVPSFACGIGIRVVIPDHLYWNELKGRREVEVDIGYGGAFYALVPASALGFRAAFSDFNNSLTALNAATRRLKAAILATQTINEMIQHPEHDDLCFLYSVIVVDDSDATEVSGPQNAELGLCFFGDQQVDQSPTGSGVAARVAVAYAKGQRKVGQGWTYHSVVSKAIGEGGFLGTIESTSGLKSRDGRDIEAVSVRIEGCAFYIGFYEFLIEKQDPIRSGFLLDRLSIA
jgi:trans-L-3-hydroxyproline dehydratase